jgi:hypothetical protein
MRIKRLRPSYASVTATLALVLAIGMGGAYAAQKITSKGIAPGAVVSKHIKDGRVKAADLGPDSVTSEKVADNAIGHDEIGFNEVGPDELAFESVNESHVQSNSVGDDELALTDRKNVVNVPAGETGTLTAPCAAGEVAISGGGGFSGSPSGAILTNSEKANGGWYVEGRNTSTSVKTLVAQAFCLKL